MTSETIAQKARALFSQILASQGQEQQAILESLTKTTEVNNAVLDLLEAHQRSTQSLFSPALDQLPEVFQQTSAETLVGKTLGAYQLVDKIGEGGMGEIFLARRHDGEFEKQVVIKLLRYGVISDELRKRFMQERQILATLEHQNIARLLDGGQTDDQLLYVVMEHIQGEHIQVYCQQQQLSVHDRVKLFIKLCSAVQYAHQNLVIHRDIKPSNVLVDQTAEPKLLDFGIATLLQSTGNQNQMQTIDNAQPLTPVYAAPEQLTNAPATTATDVYALGVMLYELLCEQRPFSDKEAVPWELQKAICNEEPARPSDVLSSAANAKSIKNIRGDLDTITLKALSNNPAKRYPTVAEFQLDLEAYLDKRPISATSPGLYYRASKFIARNRITAGLGLTSLVGTILFILLLLLQSQALRLERDTARQEQSKASAITELLLDAYQNADPTVTSGESVSAKAILDRSQTAINEQLADQPIAQASLKLNMARAYLNLNEFETGQQLAVDALKLNQAFNTEDQLELARNHYVLANSYWQTAQDQESLKHVDLAIGLLADNKATDPVLLLDAQLLKSQIQDADADMDGTELMQQTLTGYTRLLGTDHPKTINNQLLLARLFNRHLRSQEAESLLRQALDAQQRIQQPGNHLTATLQHQLATILMQCKEWDEAETLADNAIVLRSRIFGENHTTVASGFNLSASIKLNNGKFGEALDDFEKSLTIMRELLGDSDIRIALLLHNIGAAFLEQGDNLDLAESYVLNAIEKANTYYAGPHFNRAHFYYQLGKVYTARHSLSDAENSYTHSLAIHSELGNKSTGSIARIKARLAEVYYLQGKHQLAIMMLQDTLPILEEQYGKNDSLYTHANQLLDNGNLNTPAIPD